MKYCIRKSENIVKPRISGSMTSVETLIYTTEILSRNVQKH